ncbi:hypothetical protein F7725_027261, partial [Dissostichus mawsoni]
MFSCSLPAEKLAEAQRRSATLQNELQSSLDAQRESNAPPGLRRRKTMFHLSQEERCKHHNIKDLKLAFSEFYLSLILLQNYQNLNFTGFRKILKKHDKILDTPTIVTTELEGGDRQKAMKRLRVPPLGAAQPALAWTTFRVGLYCGFFIILAIAFILSVPLPVGHQHLRMAAGRVNHVLIFEINPETTFHTSTCSSILSCLYSDYTYLPMQINPLILYGFMLFLINPFKTGYYKSRFWLLKLL